MPLDLIITNVWADGDNTPVTGHLIVYFTIKNTSDKIVYGSWKVYDDVSGKLLDQSTVGVPIPFNVGEEKTFDFDTLARGITLPDRRVWSLRIEVYEIKPKEGLSDKKLIDIPLKPGTLTRVTIFKFMSGGKEIMPNEIIVGRKFYVFAKLEYQKEPYKWEPLTPGILPVARLYIYLNDQLMGYGLVDTQGVFYQAITINVPGIYVLRAEFKGSTYPYPVYQPSYDAELIRAKIIEVKRPYILRRLRLIADKYRPLLGEPVRLTSILEYEPGTDPTALCRISFRVNDKIIDSHDVTLDNTHTQKEVSTYVKFRELGSFTVFSEAELISQE